MKPMAVKPAIGLMRLSRYAFPGPAPPMKTPAWCAWAASTAAGKVSETFTSAASHRRCLDEIQWQVLVSVQMRLQLQLLASSLLRYQCDIPSSSSLRTPSRFEFTTGPHPCRIFHKS